MICPDLALSAAVRRFGGRDGAGAWLPAILLILLCLCPLNLARATESSRAPRPVIPAGRDDLFEDVTQRAGIDFVHQFCHRRIANIVLSNGSGGAVLDYDRDGWMDIYLVNWGPLAGVTAPGYCS